ncbi:hypothetical protein [Streptomyces sp. NPDC057418]|uniref:hypothetical protein n=1 Tax=Streptomyces sp. NPDC057418 TaxID=3346126 RepID=UPI0036BA32A1
MSVAEPWQGRAPGELAEDIQTGHGNKTVRIAADTMIPLLDWALRIVENIGPDVRDAWREFRQLYTGTHPGQARFAGLPRTERLNLFLRDAHHTGVSLPGDPIKHLHASRFRRTLAYFIVRRPRGLIAAALQYGHLKTKVTLNYAAQGDDSWLDDVAVERLEMALEQSEDDWTRLEEDKSTSAGQPPPSTDADRQAPRPSSAAPCVRRPVSGDSLSKATPTSTTAKP